MGENGTRCAAAVAPAVACERDGMKARRKLILRTLAIADALRQLELDAEDAGNTDVLTGTEAGNLAAAAQAARAELTDWRPTVHR